MSSVETVIAIVVIMGYSIGRQVMGEPLRVKRVIGLPAALTVIGIVEVATSKGPGPTRIDIVLIGAGCAINAVIGICQGRLMRLESRNGYLWGQMPTSVLWWWAAKVASGAVLDGIGHVLDAHLATTSAVMLLGLGINRLAQAVVVVPRAFATGVPFAPEPGTPVTELKHHGHSEKNRLLAEIGSVTSTVVDDLRTDPSTSRYAPNRPRTMPHESRPSSSRTGAPGPIDVAPTHRTMPPPNLLWETWQLFLREMNGHIKDALK